MQTSTRTILLAPVPFLLVLACTAESPSSSTASSSSSGAVSATTSSATASSAATSSSSSGASSTSSGASSSGGGPCAPTDEACTAVTSDCIALKDNTGDAVDLRMSQLRFAKPPVFAAGVLGNAVGSGVMPNLPACNLGGGGDFSWLMQLDLAANTLKTGGALPVEDPLQGYCFVDQSISGTAVAPVTASATVNNGQFDALVGDLVLPFYLTGPATTPLLIPLGHAVLSGTLSPGNDCIGRYNADTLSPEDGCEPTGGITAFTEGGTINAYMSLEAADSILVQVLNQSLCVVLSGDAAQYGNGGSPNTCRRDNDGKIVFAGDWCASTNAAADSTCSDAVQVQGAYAAAGVTINGTCD